MRYLKLLLSISIAVTALTGDYIVFRSKNSESQLFRAVSDSLTHGLVGFLSSLAFFSHDLNVSSDALALNAVFCTLISSLVDVDHFMLAKSFRLRDIASLKERGIFHCTSLWLLFTLTLLTYSYLLRKNNTFLITWMLIIAFTSHHVRDGNRRGLWMYPFGSTPPLNKYLYVGSLVILPYFFAVTYKGINFMKPTTYSLDYTVV